MAQSLQPGRTAMAIRILMADGELSVLEMAKAATTSFLWCELVTVSDGREAAKLLSSQKFHGVVMAGHLPHLDRFELIRHLKGSPLNAGVPIVMLTDEDDIEMMRRGFKSGVTFFAIKPPNRERFYRLFSAVRGAMENEQRRHYRLPYHTKVTCTFGDQNQNRFVAETIEIGEGGIAVKPSGGTEVGQILELEFLLPQLSRPSHSGTPKSRKALFAEREAHATGPQKVRACVRYLTPDGEIMGLDFQGLTPAQRQVIQHYIAGGS
jgi:CheY-like chemotaxis protein